MSELIQKHDNRATIRWKLLTGVSALALAAAVSSSGVANAADADHPQLWIEFGGDAAAVSGEGQPFVLPFMTINAASPAFDPVSPLRVQKPPSYSFGGEAAISFQPEDSNWVFSASFRYGRSNNNRYTHQQTKGPAVPTSSYTYQEFLYYGAHFPYATGLVNYAEFKAHHSEKHAILDFQAGKDMGLGLFGGNSTSVLSAGVRMARFDANATIKIHARPDLVDSNFNNLFKYDHDFHQYYLDGSSARSFHGIGPSVSWNSSVPLAGNTGDGELALDWGINAAVLFGKQTAKVHHHTTGFHYKPGKYYYSNHRQSAYNTSANPSRSRNVTVPNIGGFAAIAYHFQDAKVSIGYRYDTFLGAMDTGIDTAKTSAMTFKGPFASISIGVGD